MNVIDALRLPPAATGGANPNKLGQAEFLRLLTAQLQNQDPFKPMENGEFLGQMAQFSTASGIHDLQAGFQQLAQALSTQQTLQAASLVGRSVLVPGEHSVLTPGAGLQGVAELPAGGALTLEFFDATGQRLQRLELGAQSPGPVRFAWDGRTASGAEAQGPVRVSAFLQQGRSQTAVPTALFERVASVRLGEGEVTLDLSGGDSVSLAAVRQIH